MTAEHTAETAKARAVSSHVALSWTHRSWRRRGAAGWRARAGRRAARKAVREKASRSNCLKIYVFSSELAAARRPIRELTGLIKFYVKRSSKASKRRRSPEDLGDHNAFEADVARLVDAAVARTAGNRRMTVAIALNYGARGELVNATRKLAGQAAAGELDPAAIDEAHIEAALDTHDLPPLDLLIRTSGEQRLSNFLLWQAAYAELLFVDTLWPDFDEAVMQAALAEYARREPYAGLLARPLSRGRLPTRGAAGC